MHRAEPERWSYFGSGVSTKAASTVLAGGCELAPTHVKKWDGQGKVSHESDGFFYSFRGSQGLGAKNVVGEKGLIIHSFPKL